MYNENQAEPLEQSVNDRGEIIYDHVIIGRGLIEMILACKLTMINEKVIVLDDNSYFDCYHSSFRVSEFSSLLSASSTPSSSSSSSSSLLQQRVSSSSSPYSIPIKNIIIDSNPSIINDQLYSFIDNVSIDISPNILLAKGSMLTCMIDTSSINYIDHFQSIEQTYLLDRVDHSNPSLPSSSTRPQQTSQQLQLLPIEYSRDGKGDQLARLERQDQDQLYQLFSTIYILLDQLDSMTKTTGEQMEFTRQPYDFIPHPSDFKDCQYFLEFLKVIRPPLSNRVQSIVKCMASMGCIGTEGSSCIDSMSMEEGMRRVHQYVTSRCVYGNGSCIMPSTSGISEIIEAMFRRFTVLGGITLFGKKHCIIEQQDKNRNIIIKYYDHDQQQQQQQQSIDNYQVIKATKSIITSPHYLKQEQQHHHHPQYISHIDKYIKQKVYSRYVCILKPNDGDDFGKIKDTLPNSFITIPIQTLNNRNVVNIIKQSKYHNNSMTGISSTYIIVHITTLSSSSIPSSSSYSTNTQPQNEHDIVSSSSISTTEIAKLDLEPIVEYFINPKSVIWSCYFTIHHDHLDHFVKVNLDTLEDGNLISPTSCKNNNSDINNNNINNSNLSNPSNIDNLNNNNTTTNTTTTPTFIICSNDPYSNSIDFKYHIDQVDDIIKIVLSSSSSLLLPNSPPISK